MKATGPEVSGSPTSPRPRDGQNAGRPGRRADQQRRDDRLHRDVLARHELQLAQPDEVAGRQTDRMAVDAKQWVRERIWRAFEDEGVARFPGARGRIPNFRGAEAAAACLAEQPEWRAAAVVKSNPDAPQL